MSQEHGKIKVVVRDIVDVTSEVKRFEFVRADGQRFPGFSGGAHIVVEMDDAGTRRLNPYSLMSSPEDTSCYAISVRRDDNGRGGSLYLHKHLKVGDTLLISNPNNFFALDRTATKYLMIAGGIGITPFLSQLKQLNSSKGRLGNLGQVDHELHYFARNADVAAYLDDLRAHPSVAVQSYFGSMDPAGDLADVLSRQPLGTHLYVCGPKLMIDAIVGAAANAGWPEQDVHFEEFTAPEPGQPFDVKLSLSDKIVNVGSRETLLEAMEAAGVNPPSQCRGGACGQCETKVVSCDGEILHYDHWLDDEQKENNTHIMPCLSRFRGRELVIER